MEPSTSPADDHARWEARAISHVMGGLGADESSEFRRHLLRCSRCKAQVRELRDLAGTLTLAAREERSRQAIRLADRPDADDGEEPDSGDHDAVAPSGRSLAVIVLAVAAIGLLVWSNLQLRGEVAAGHRNAQVVAGLATGLVVEDVERTGMVSGQVVVDEDTITWSFSGLPEPPDGQILVVWLVPANGPVTKVAAHALSRPDGGVLAGTVVDDTARQLVITMTPLADLKAAPGGGVEPAARSSQPPGSTLVVAHLDAVRVSGATARDGDGEPADPLEQASDLPVERAVPGDRAGATDATDGS